MGYEKFKIENDRKIRDIQLKVVQNMGKKPKPRSKIKENPYKSIDKIKESIQRLRGIFYTNILVTKMFIIIHILIFLLYFYYTHICLFVQEFPCHSLKIHIQEE